MSGLAIFLIFVLVGIMTSPRGVGRWAADVREAYDQRRSSLQDKEGRRE